MADPTAEATISVSTLVPFVRREGVVVNRRSALYYDGKYYQAGHGPTRLTSSSFTGVSATEASFVTTVDRSDGVLYVVVSTSVTPPASSDIIAGTISGSVVAASNAAVSSAGQRTVSFTGLAEATPYYFHAVHVSASGWRSNQVVTAQFTTADAWSTIQNQTVDDTYPNTIVGLKAAHLTNYQNYTVTVHDNPAAGNDLVATGVVTFTDANDGADTLTVNSNPGGKQIFLRATESQESAAEADWQQRISGTGVVWYHDFRSDAEVDNFNWDSHAWCRRITTDSITGGGCLELFRAEGSAEGGLWWRPFSPLVGTGNGKGVDDPAANNTLTVRAYDPSNVVTAVNQHQHGYYGHADYHNEFFDGDEFWLQMRIKRDPARATGTPSGGGKLHDFLTCTNIFPGAQTLVVTSILGHSQHNNAWQAYSYWELGGAFNLFHQGDGQDGTVQPGGDTLTLWEFSFGWDTLMYHFIPGHAGTVRDTLFEVYAAHPGDTDWTLFTSQNYHVNSFLNRNGWQAIAIHSYQNNEDGIGIPDFSDRYDQIIFARGSTPIPFPAYNPA